jgi:predicted kinase
MIVMMTGLPGSGKSTLARAIARRLPGMVLDKDVIRAALFEPDQIEYSQEQDDFCQEIMLQTAGYLLRKHPAGNVLLDGRTFSRRYQREGVFAFCRQSQARVAILECVCAEDTAIKRLTEAVVKNTHLAANRTAALYYRIREVWEPIESPKWVVDTDTELESCVEEALCYLLDRMQPCTDQR